ncbi:serine protease 55 [Petaurus breviceps papuanus]|uniref:serine protease 55 n=1 Tax=Petaurus breviceps papuanus TaxID=3040969 RepID=UPI0036DA58C9
MEIHIGERCIHVSEITDPLNFEVLTESGYGEITTEIQEGQEFFYAEDYHQQYLSKNPNGYCVPCGQIHISPVLKTEAAAIIGGVDTSRFQVPWHVSIYFNNTFLCGGSILDNLWILTASHCFKDDSTSYLEMRISLEGFNQKIVEKKNVSKLILHPNFDQLFMDNDIALMLLSSPIEFSMQKIPICLKRNVYNVKECWVSGWGFTKPMKQMDFPLQKVKLELIDLEECYKMTYMLTDNMICAWDPEGKKDSCQGDSGGPLFCNQRNNEKIWYQVGIVSWGEGCGRKEKPGVYTAISSYLLWIVLKTREAGHPYIISSSEHFFAPPQCLILSLYFSSLLLQKIFFLFTIT